jgi:hypothetical protein
MKRLFSIIFILLGTCLPLHAAYEDFTTYTEDPSDATITQGTDTLTATSYTGGGVVYKRLGNEFFAGANIRFKTTLTALDANTQVTVATLSNEPSPEYSALGALSVRWSTTDGTNFQLDLAGTDTTDSTTAGTTATFYCELRRTGIYAWLFVYSDDAYATLVDTLAISDLSETATWAYLSFLQTDPSPDVIEEDWNTVGLTGWTDSSNGDAIFASGVLAEGKLTAALTDYGTTGSNGYTDKQGVTGLDSTYTLVWREKYENLGADGGDRYAYQWVYSGSHRFRLKIYNDIIFVYNNSGGVDSNGTITTSNGTWYEWKAVVSGANATVSRRIAGTIDWGSAVLTSTNLYVDTSNAGRIRNCGTVDITPDRSDHSNNMQVHQDFVKVYSVDPATLTPTITVTVEDVEVSSFNQMIAVDPLVSAYWDSPASGVPVPAIADQFNYASRAAFVSSSWVVDRDYPTDSTGVSGDVMTMDTTNGRLQVENRGVAHIAFTAGAIPNYSLGADVTIDNIGDGETISIMSAYLSTTKFFELMARRIGDNYYWGLAYYDAGHLTTENTEYLLELDISYYVQLIAMNKGGTPSGSGTRCGVFIDGVMVADIDSSDIFYINPTFYTPDTIYIGNRSGEHSSSSGSKFYVDNLTMYEEQTSTHSGMALLQGGDIVTAIRYANVHGYDVSGELYTYISDDNGVSWSYHDEIDINTDLSTTNEDARCQGSLVTVGEDVYLFARSRNDTDRDYYWQIHVYKATMSGGVLGPFSIITGVNLLGYNLTSVIDMNDESKILITVVDLTSFKKGDADATIKFDAESSAFTVGKTLTNGTATATIEDVYTDGWRGRLFVSSISGTFSDNDSLTESDGTGAATAAGGAVTTAASDTEVFLLTYETDTDTFLSSEDWVKVGSAGDITNTFPNETSLFYDPVDTDRLIAMTRWDDYTGGTDIKIETYKVCDLSDTNPGINGDYLDSTNWGSRQEANGTWREGKAGNITTNTIGDYIYLTGYSQQHTPVTNARANFLAKIDASDMSLVNEKRWGWGTNEKGGETGNGASLYLGDGKTILTLLNSGVTMAMAFEVKIVFPFGMGGVSEPAAVGGVDNPAAIGGVTF